MAAMKEVAAAVRGREAYQYYSAAEWWPPVLQLSASMNANAAGGAAVWFNVFIVAIVVAGVVLSLLVPFLLSEHRVLPAPTFSRRDRKSIGRLVLPATAVKMKAHEDDSSRGYVSRVWEAVERKFAGHSWKDVELMIGEMAWADDFAPLIVFINTKSGGKQGVHLAQQLYSLLHALQVVNLQEEGPEAALQWWSSNVKKYRILVCGGDGTVGWVLSSLETLKLDYMPPVAILPLGTGNDLARVLGWGGGFQGGGTISFLRHVSEARVSLLDRWTVVCRDLVPQNKRWRAGSSSSSPSEEPRRRERKHLSMNNYIGIGIDAAIALDFHQMRERRPSLFFSRLVNKLWYAKGFLAYLRRTCGKIHTKVTIVCDGVPLELPTNLKGVIILNIPSFAGGSDLWGTGEESEDGDTSDLQDDTMSEPETIATTAKHRRSSSEDHTAQFVRPSAQDQRLEVVGVNSLRLGAAQVGLRAGKRLAQARTVKIYNQASCPVQVDGEPFTMEEGGEIEISWKGEAFMLARSREQADTIATDVIDWALHRSIIDVKQRNELMKETARRLQEHRMRPSGSAVLLAAG